MSSVALAHDILAARAGGERVLAALADTFPHAPIHTLIHEPTQTFTAIDTQRVRPSWLNRIGPLHRHYRATIPLAALTFAAMRIDAAITICSTAGLSHHVRTTGAKLVYCHTPARWLHDRDSYLRGFGRPVRFATALMRPPFAWLDRSAMRGADRIVANSHQIAAEVERVYGRRADVIAPCSTLELDGPVDPIPHVEPGFTLSPARPLAYKRLDVLADAARALPDRTFLHIGAGPHRAELLAHAPPNFVSVGSVTDAQLRWAYRNATLCVLTCAEDFGLVPLEAAAHGLTTVAPLARGFHDHSTDFLVTYEFANAEALAEAITSAPSSVGGLHPERLQRERFATAIRDAVDSIR